MRKCTAILRCVTSYVQFPSHRGAGRGQMQRPSWYTSKKAKLPDRKSLIRPLIPSKWYIFSMRLKFNLFPMCSRNLIYIGLCLLFFFLSPLPSLSPFLSLLFFLSLLLFSDFEFLKRIHQHRLGAVFTAHGCSTRFFSVVLPPRDGFSRPDIYLR